MPLRRVNAQYVSTGFEQCRDPLLIVAGVDSRTNNIAFVIVQQFIGVLLMALIVLAEDKTAQTPILRENGERVELMLPSGRIRHSACSMTRLCSVSGVSPGSIQTAF